MRWNKAILAVSCLSILGAAGTAFSEQQSQFETLKQKAAAGKTAAQQSAEAQAEMKQSQGLRKQTRAEQTTGVRPTFDMSLQRYDINRAKSVIPTSDGKFVMTVEARDYKQTWVDGEEFRISEEKRIAEEQRLAAIAAAEAARAAAEW